jgi:hypothetical protein
MPNIPEGLQRGGSRGSCEFPCRYHPSGINRVALTVYRWWRFADHRLIAEIPNGLVFFPHRSLSI